MVLFQTMVINHHFQSFCGHQGVKFGQRGPKANQFQTLTQLVYTASLNWIAWMLFLDNGRKPPFSVILWPLESTKIWQTRPKNEWILNIHLISVHTKFELDCMNAFSDNGRKAPFSVILWPLEDQNLTNVAQKQMNSEHSPNKCTHEIFTGLREYFLRWWSETTIFGHFVAIREPKFGQHGPKANQF